MTPNSMTYTSRQRVLDALERREPDRIPFDLGSSIETGMTAQAYQALIELLGLTEEADETLPNLFLTAAGIAQIPELPDGATSIAIDTQFAGRLVAPRAL